MSEIHEKYPIINLESSKTIEDLLNDITPPFTHNWLLSYLDVFVLIVMLIITLISIGDIKFEEQEKSTVIKSDTSIVKSPSPIINGWPFLLPDLSQSQDLPEFKFPIAEKNPPPLISFTVEKPSEQNDDSKDSKLTVTELEPDTLTDTPSEQKPEITVENSYLEQLTSSLKNLGMDKNVAIRVDEDYAQLEIQDKILFESSQAELLEPGKLLLNSLATLLLKTTGLIFIEGHTDNRPIQTTQFPSNWELGAARATSVLHYLSTQGLDTRRMRAVTYADTMPVADNSTPEGREKNRRVSILIKVQEKDVLH